MKDCTGRVCGPDPVCGQSCGSCTAPETCNSEGQCCLKDCTGRVCGPDPVCGESCGSCGSNTYCDDGTCVPNIGIEWVRIVGGTFSMGSNDGYSDERPVHSVTVPTFEMSKTAVTVDQYRACVDAGSCTAPGTGTDCNWDESRRGSHPVNCVDWDQAQDFANWVGGRLPSEAEWEYAARSGGRDWKYPWGDEEATCERAVMYDGSGPGCGRGSTWPVCSKPSGNTTQGLCDMAGNVYEWVQDWYHDTYDGAPTDGSAWESPAGSTRVIRGGSWHRYAGHVRAANRNFDGPRIRSAYVGFRLARSVP
ncbi:MAG: Serine/threonine-protein kinase pkn1 [Deltaproteobacteria bacterium ADurb.Bin058]|nr:MAG: Serine/threonine-protein kinase pkn1 [Deltaproteobacteria bacterium ADurb.Bin058]